MTAEWRWISPKFAVQVHELQIAQHGGASGTRDPGLLESALARPQHLAAYGEPDVADLAAAYCEAIVRNHPFVDGNKRTGTICMLTFLRLNGARLNSSSQELAPVIWSLADGQLNGTDLAAWIRQRLA